MIPIDTHILFQKLAVFGGLYVSILGWLMLKEFKPRKNWMRYAIYGLIIIGILTIILDGFYFLPDALGS